MHPLRVVALSLPLFLAACVGDVGAGKVAATEVEAAPTEAARAPTGTAIAIDPAHSRVRALGAKITAKHPIDFDDWSGTLRVEGDQLVGVDVTIQMASLRSDVDKLTQHLKTEDFFDVAGHPTATFRSTSVVARPGADGATHVVTGELTLHGVEKRVSFPATVEASSDRLDARAEFVIDRKDYGIVYPGMPDDLIQDNVVLTIELSGQRTES